MCRSTSQIPPPSYSNIDLARWVGRAIHPRVVKPSRYKFEEAAVKLHNNTVVLQIFYGRARITVAFGTSFRPGWARAPRKWRVNLRVHSVKDWILHGIARVRCRFCAGEKREGRNSKVPGRIFDCGFLEHVSWWDMMNFGKLS